MRQPHHFPLWRDANRLLLAIEQAVRHFPRYHKYTLSTDLRRQAMAICQFVRRFVRRAAPRGEDQVARVTRLVEAVDDLKRSTERRLAQAPCLALSAHWPWGWFVASGTGLTSVSLLNSQNRREAPPMTGLMTRTITTLGLGLFMIATEAEQTCNDAAVATAPNSRFQDNGNGTVTDLATGLIWKQCPEGLSGADCATGNAETFTWQAALQHAEAAVFANSDLWRMPNVKELASLVEWRCHSPSINERYFPNTPSSQFWSSSPRAFSSFSSSHAWEVAFNHGRVGLNGTGFEWSIRLVRAGQ